MSKIKNIFVYCATMAITTVALAGCTAPIEIDTKDAEPRIVIYGEFSSFWDTQYVTLSSSAGYFSGEQVLRVWNANVWVTSSDGHMYEMTKNDDWFGYPDVGSRPELTAYYHAEIHIVPGVTYTLNVRLDFDGDGIAEIYTASSTALPLVELESISIEEYSTTLWGEEMSVYKLLYSMQEPGDTQNYYVYKISGGTTGDGTGVDTGNLLYYTLKDDLLTNGQYIKDELFNLYQSSNHFVEWSGQGGTATILFSQGSTISLYQCNVEKGFYDFVRLAQKSTQSSNPMFGGPPANIPTNIKGGAGYFTVYCMDEKSASVP